MMNEQQISDRLIAVHAAYVERTGKQPYIGPSIDISAGGRTYAILYGASIADRIDAVGTDATTAFARMDALIAAIPSEAERLGQEAAKAVADAIEKCRAAGYDADFVNPLIEMSKRISENALTHEAAE